MRDMHVTVYAVNRSTIVDMTKPTDFVKILPSPPPKEEVEPTNMTLLPKKTDELIALELKADSKLY